jgi:hypothetical protein
MYWIIIIISKSVSGRDDDESLLLPQSRQRDRWKRMPISIIVSILSIIMYYQLVVLVQLILCGKQAD